MKAKGDIEVSMVWTRGIMDAVMLKFKSQHPWLQGLMQQDLDTSSTKERKGFYNARNRTGIPSVCLTVLTPNSLRAFVESSDSSRRLIKVENERRNSNINHVFSKSKNNSCAILNDEEIDIQSYPFVHSMHMTHLTILRFPCVVRLCNSKGTSCGHRIFSDETTYPFD